MVQKISEAVFEATKTMNNMKKHDYSVQDYKMCPAEAEVVIKALSFYIDALKMDGLSVPDIFGKLDEAINTFDEATKDLRKLQGLRDAETTI